MSKKHQEKAPEDAATMETPQATAPDPETATASAEQQETGKAAAADSAAVT